MLSQLQLTAPAPLSLNTMLVNLLLGMALSAIFAWYYTRFGQSLSNRAKFALLLPALTLTTALVISIVKSSLALSLGLVGALSIVRFRTAIKDPEELIYLFIAIAIGLATGADQRGAAIVGALIILAYLSLPVFAHRQPPKNNLYLNIHAQEDTTTSALFDEINTILLKHARTADVRRIDSRAGTFHATYLINCPDNRAVGALIDALKTALPSCEVSFVEQRNVLSS